MRRTVLLWLLTVYVLTMTFGVTQLKFWTFLNPESPDPRGVALKSIIQDFEKQNPDIDIVVESIHWREIDLAAIRATAAGMGPDILNVYSDQLMKHVSAGTLLPLDDLFETWYEENSDDYIWSRDMLTINGHVWSLAWESRVWLLWYREDILDSLGLKLPTTLYELAEVAGKIREAYPNITGYAWGLSTKSLGAEFMETFIGLLYGNGGVLLDENGKAAFNSDAGVKVMKWLRDLVHLYGAADYSILSMDADDVLSGIQSGTIAMTTEGSMRVSTARSAEGIGYKIKTMPTPSFSKDHPSAAYTAGQTIGIGSNTKHPEMAWRFIKFMLSPASQLKWAKAGVMPVRVQTYSDPYFNTQLGKEMIRWKSFINDYGVTFFPPEDYSKLSEILANTAQKIILNPGTDIKNALDEAAKEYDEYHAKYSK